MTEVLVPPGDHELILTPQRLRQSRVGIDDARHVLAHVETAEVQDEARPDAIAFTHPGQEPRIPYWIEALVHAVRDDVDALGCKPQDLDDVALGALGDGDHRVRAPRASRDERE